MPLPGVTCQDDARDWLSEFDQRRGRLARRLAGDHEAARLAAHAQATPAEADTLRRVVNGETVATIAASRDTSGVARRGRV